jgi:cyclophilin family peptidyl-prolyl cis-trans isomerase
VAVVVALAARADAPALDTPAPQRVIFHTVAGDLVFVLFPQAAPKTVEHFLKMVAAGVYDTTAFVRVEPGFVIQVSNAADRKVPFTQAQQALIHRLPAEFNALKHERGILSMAREDADVNTAETSFSILLGAAPHLDGKYTVFGRLEQGYGVLEEMLKVPREGNRPTERLQIEKAVVLPTVEALSHERIAPPRPIPFVAPKVEPLAPVLHATSNAVTIETADAETSDRTGVAVGGGALLIVLIGLLSFSLQGRVPPSVHTSLNLVMVLVAAFLFIVLATPVAQHHEALAVVLFFGLLGVLKVLGRFEIAMERK